MQYERKPLFDGTCSQTHLRTTRPYAIDSDVQEQKKLSDVYVHMSMQINPLRFLLCSAAYRCDSRHRTLNTFKCLCTLFD